MQIGFQMVQVAGTLACDQYNISNRGLNMISHHLKEVIPLTNAYNSVATSI